LLLFSVFYSLKFQILILTFSVSHYFPQDNTLIQNALSFYRLMIVWLVGLVGGFKMPLPNPCPMEFSAMPEHFVEDALELLIFASRIPKALDGVVLVDFTSNGYFL
jgi:hypothetical protein